MKCEIEKLCYLLQTISDFLSIHCSITKTYVKPQKTPMLIIVCCSSLLLVGSSFLEMVILLPIVSRQILEVLHEKGVLQNLQYKDTCQFMQ